MRFYAHIMIMINRQERSGGRVGIRGILIPQHSATDTTRDATCCLLFSILVYTVLYRCRCRPEPVLSGPYTTLTHLVAHRPTRSRTLIELLESLPSINVFVYEFRECTNSFSNAPQALFNKLCRKSCSDRAHMQAKARDWSTHLVHLIAHDDVLLEDALEREQLVRVLVTHEVDRPATGEQTYGVNTFTETIQSISMFSQGNTGRNRTVRVHTNYV